MLRYVPGRSSDRRRGNHSTKGDQRGTRTTSNALHVQAGRPLIYEPQRVGAERIGTEELEGLLQIEAEASGIGIGNRGWKQVCDSEGALLEQWEPGPDDAESENIFFRAMLPLEGVPLSTALSQMFDPAERQQWDSTIESIRCVPTVKTRTNSDDVQSDVVHFRTVSLLGMFPAGECIMWRSLMKRDGGSLATVLLRNAEVNVATGEINKDADSSWGSIMGPCRIKKLVIGHVFRSLDKTNEMKGSRVFTYVQVKANTALQYAAPTLFESLAKGSRDEYRTACLAAVASLNSEVKSRTSEDAEFYDISSQYNDEDASEKSAWDFLGGALGKLSPQNKKTRKTHRASVREARRSNTRTSLQAPLRVVQLHRASAPELDSTPRDPPVELENKRPTFTTDGIDRRSRAQRLRERSRALQHDSMAQMSKRLSSVMHERGSVQMEDEFEDGHVDRNDTMAWLGNLVDLRMSTQLSAVLEDSPLTEEPGSSTDAQVVWENVKADANLTTSSASSNPGIRNATGDMSTSTKVETVVAGEIQSPDGHDLDPVVALQVDKCNEQVDPVVEPKGQYPASGDAASGLQGQAAIAAEAPELSATKLSTSSDVVVHQHHDNPDLPPSSALTLSSETASHASGALRKRFTLPKVSRSRNSKIALSAPSPTSSQREVSPTPSSLSNPCSSCYDIYAEECRTSLSDELAVAQHSEQKGFAASPQAGKIIQVIGDQLDVQSNKILVESLGSPGHRDSAGLYVGGLEPEPGPEPGPGSPCFCPPRRPPGEDAAFPTLVHHMKDVDRLPHGNGEGHPMEGVQSSGTRLTMKAQLGGGRALARSEDAATTPAADAMLFCSLSEITNAAKAAKKIKSKAKSNTVHRKSRR